MRTDRARFEASTEYRAAGGGMEDRCGGEIQSGDRVVRTLRRSLVAAVVALFITSMGLGTAETLAAEDDPPTPPPTTVTDAIEESPPPPAPDPAYLAARRFELVATGLSILTGVAVAFILAKG
jgi:hypothetical protein